ncbi:MAG: hypothetical protein ACTTGZ_09910 [Treponema sp.]
MRKTNGMLKAFISFWSWMAITLSSFLMIVLTAFSPIVSKPFVIVFAILIFGLSLAVPVINPGIFVKRHTTATGDCNKSN